MASVILSWAPDPIGHSLRCPGSLVVSNRYRNVARNGIVVELSITEKMFLLALAARPGHIIPTKQMIDLMWGLRADGGPDRAAHMLSHLARRVRPAFAALGYVLRTHYGQGYEAAVIL